MASLQLNATVPNATKGPEAILTFDPPGPEFAISEQAVMPVIKVSANVKNLTPVPGQCFIYKWNVSLVFTGRGCPHSLLRTIRHPEIHSTVNSSSAVNHFTIPFTQVRGGQLKVSLTVTCGTTILNAQRQDLFIIGTNPSPGSLTTALVSADPLIADVMKKLMQQESGLKQFLTAGGKSTSKNPYFSEDDYGGVGLSQITHPAPTDDQVWSWKANLLAGVDSYHRKHKIARAYPENVRKGSHFQNLVRSYNQQRAVNKQTLLAVTLPDYTDEQLRNDTLRGYDGYAGGLHEYRIQMDSKGLLMVTVTRDNSTGEALWERVTADMRRAAYAADQLPKKKWGDPNYVENVLSQRGF